MPNVDSLNISISATAQKANSSLDNLIKKLDDLSGSLQRINNSSINGMSNSIERMGRATSTLNMSNFKASDFNKLANGLQKMGSVQSSLVNSAADSIQRLGKAANFMSGSSFSEGTKQISEIATSIKKLGNKSSSEAIKNIPLLAEAMKELMTTLSSAPKVSQNLIDMTNALAKLARTGSSSGKAVKALSGTLNNFSTSSEKAKTRSFSLASAIGKVYATYWLLFRAMGKIKDAIDISSDLTEVQNVVNATFGQYSGLLEKFSDTSIVDYGISELAAKKTASTFQAMGTAMGFSQGKMANMSVELTKLSADMASFYNLSQEDVAEDLNSVFTGMSRPLRQYGLDLTEATLKEWAMKNGLDADIKSMSQAEKTMLRYRYVMANTGAAQGDFQKTSMTWSNQVKILTENIKALGAVTGGTFINLLKPAVVSLNVIIAKLTEFATAVSNSLGKIFGWQYEDGAGGMATDYEDAADSAGNIADSTGAAANNIKKMRAGLRAFDELKTINLSDGDSASGGSESGNSGTGAGSSSSGGQWTKVDSIFKDYESSLDSLYKLGDYIGTKLTNTLNSIDWNSVYEGAKSFGSGLASFLNGLISPELFGAVGKTIAGALNTAIKASLSFAENFEFEEFGKSISNGVKSFFDEFDADDFANSIDAWVQGLCTAFKSFVSDEEMWKSALGDVKDFLTNLDLETVEIIIGTLTVKSIGKIIFGFSIKEWIIEKITTALSGLTLSQIVINITGFVFDFGNTPGFIELATRLYDQIDDALQKLLPDWAFNFLSNLGAGIVAGAALGSWFPGAGQIAGAIIGGIVGAMAGIEIDGKSILKHIVDSIFNFDLTADLASKTAKFFSDAKKAFEKQDWGSLGSNLLNGILTGITTGLTFLVEPLSDSLSIVWSNIKTWWKENVKLPKINVPSIGDIKAALKEKWNSAKDWWTEKKGSLSKVSVSMESLKTKLKNAWKTAKDWWDKNVKLKIPKLNFKVTYKQASGAIQKAVVKALSLKGWPSLQFFASGGFPEDGTFRASHGEIMGRFDNGKSVVANNMQITEGISAAVYRGNQQLLGIMQQELEESRRQNEFLKAILEKETGISLDDVFNGVRRKARDYTLATGNPAF